MVRKWIKGGGETGANRYRSTRTLNFLPLLPLLPAAAVSCLIKLCPRALSPLRPISFLRLPLAAAIETEKLDQRH